MIKSALVLAAMLASSACFAQTTYECDYPTYSDGKTVRPSNGFKLSFIVDGKSAYMLGNNGSSRVEQIFSVYGPTFLEQSPIGNVMMTTIASSDGASSHSRGTRIDGKLLPSQYYGKCVTK